MSAAEVALKRQIAMDAHRLALMPENLRAAYEAEWRNVLERNDHEQG